MLENQLENAILPTNDVPKTANAETAKEKFERERLSRRQALKRFGMTSAMATFALFSVDDLARMVGKAMQQRTGDNKVAAQIAQEFQQSGAAFAAPSGSSCTHCINQWNIDSQNATTAYTDCISHYVQYGVGTVQAVAYCNADNCSRLNNAAYNYNGCCAVWCAPGSWTRKTSGC